MLRPLSVVLKNRFSCFNGNGYLSRVTILRTKKLTLTYLSKTKTTFQVSVGLSLESVRTFESEATGCQQAGKLAGV